MEDVIHVWYSNQVLEAGAYKVEIGPVPIHVKFYFSN